jgi:peptidoglycan/LPS O-acetylase OafA/YrhL
MISILFGGGWEPGRRRATQLHWGSVSASTGLVPSRRLDAITGLRWWAAFAVFAHHIQNLVPLPAPLAAVAGFGHLGVTFFFVLSGFVLTWSWRESVDKRTFWWRRFSRIYPLTFVTLLVAIPVFYSFSPDPAQPWVKPVDVGILVLCVFLLQGWWRDPTILFAGNPAAWTLTVEAFFYAMHPFVTLGLKRLGRRGALIAAAGVVAFALATRILIIVEPHSWVAALPWPILRFNEFVLGMCLAWAFRRGWLPRIPVWIPLVFLGGWIAMLILTERAPAAIGYYSFVAPYTNEAVTIGCALLIVATASAELRGRTRILSASVFVRLGEWSYAFYLIHATLIYAVLNVIGRQPGGWHAVFWCTVLLAASIAAAWALHVYVERPVEKRLRHWQIARRERSATAVKSSASA